MSIWVKAFTRNKNMCALSTEFLWHLLTIMHFCLMTFMNRAVTDPHSHHLSSIGGAFLFMFVSARRLCCSNKHPLNSVAYKQSFFPTHATCPSQVSRELGVLGQNQGPSFTPVAYLPKQLDTTIQGWPACIHALGAAALPSQESK